MLINELEGGRLGQFVVASALPSIHFVGCVVNRHELTSSMNSCMANLKLSKAWAALKAQLFFFLHIPQGQKSGV